MIQLSNCTANLFDRFANSGTLGEGSQTKKLGILERMELAAAPDVYDKLLKADNNSNFDGDSRIGFVSFTKAQGNRLMLGGINAQSEPIQSSKSGAPALLAEGLITPEEAAHLPQADPESGATLKQDVREMLSEGLVTPEEAAHMREPAGLHYVGTVGKNGDTLRGALETLGGPVHDIEFVQVSPTEVLWMTVTDRGNGFQADANRLDRSTGETYSETLSGGWNALP